MSKVVSFHRYIGNPKKINKEFSNNYGTMTINPTDFIDDQEPQLVLNYDSTIYNNANYAIIGNDYYFMSGRGLDTAQRMVLKLEKDLLMTNKAEILQTPIIVERSTEIIDSWMADTLEAHTVQKITQNYLIGDLRPSLTASCKIVLAAVGSKDVITRDS